MKRTLAILSVIIVISQPVFGQTTEIPGSTGIGSTTEPGNGSTGTGGIYSSPDTGSGTGITTPNAGTYQSPGIYQNPNRPTPYPNIGPGSTGGTGVLETPGINRPGSINPSLNNSTSPGTNSGINNSNTKTQTNSNSKENSTGGAAKVRGYW